MRGISEWPRKRWWTMMWLIGAAAHGLAAPAALAQGRAEAVVSGVVTDQTGSVLPGVTVTATNAGTALLRTGTTEADGRFRLAALTPGNYVISAELSGFATIKKQVTLTVGAEATLDLQLGLGDMSETLTVTGGAPLIESTRTEQAVTLTEKEVRNLPTDSRDFQSFALLAPGVVRARTTGAGWGGEAGFSTSGNRGDQNAINIDGLTNRQFSTGLEAGSFSQEAVQEFQVITQSYPAEYGGSAGGVINAVTRSGTNRFTGYGFLFVRDDAFAKAPFTLSTNSSTGEVTAQATSEKSDFRRTIGGVSVGGPLLRDKLFFYTVIDRLQSEEPRVRTIQPATLDLVRRTAYPNLPDDPAQNVTSYEPTSTKFSLKLDQNFNSRHTAAYRFSSADSFSPAGAASGRNSVTTTSQSDTRFLMTSGSLNSFLTDRLLNSVRAQWNDTNMTTTWPNLGGAANLSSFPAYISIGGTTGGNFGRSNGGGQPYNDETKWEFQDTLTWSRKAHEIKVGGTFTVMQYWLDFSRPDGVWTFSDLNAYVAGRPAAFEQGYGPGAAYLANKYVSLFAQDEWKINDALTINAGVRYDLAIYPTDVTSWTVKEGTINASTGEVYTTGGQPAMAPGFANDTNNVMPRLGITWSPDKGKTLFRAGGGTFYGNQYVGELANALLFGGPPMGTRYRFTPALASQIWNGLVDPNSPYYNASGLRRLAPGVEAMLPAQGVLPTVIRFQRELEMPYSAQGNVGVDRQIGSALVVSGSFLWSRGWNNVRSVNINAQSPTFYAQGSLLPTGVVAPYDLNLHAGPRPDPTVGENLMYFNNGSVRYKGASAGVTLRKAGGMVRASYTFTDSWDDSASITIRNGPADLVSGVAGEWARSLLATRHRLVVSGVYALPQTWPVWARDWQVAGIINLESGHPFQVQSGSDFNNDTVLTDRPFGVPRNALMTDPIYNTDARISRFIPLGGRFKAELMFEMFNLFNTAHYDNYVDSLYVFNSATNTYVPRPDFAAFAGTPAINQRDNERSFDDIGLNAPSRRNSVGAPFQGQFAIRLHF